jgi:autotransporter-associated beta strand protein
VRLAPATDIWTGMGTNTNWSTAQNWNTHQVPVIGDDLVFPSGVPSASLTNTNNLVNYAFNSITFSGSNYNLKGNNPITLGSAPGGNSIILNAGASGNSISFDIIMGGAAGNRQFFTEKSGADLTLIGKLKGTTGVELTKDGVGTLILTNDNSGFTGPITVQQGVLQITNANALGDTSHSTTVQQPGQLQVSNVVGSIAENLILNGPGPINDGALLNVAGNNTWTGTIRMDSDTTFGAAANSSLNILGQISDLSNGHNVTKEGAGQIIFSTTNTYRGSTTINNGILTIRDPGALGSADGTPATGTVVNKSITETGTLQIEDPSGVGFTVQNELLTLNGPGVTVNGANVGALENVNGNNTWTGPVILGSPAPNGSDVTIGVDITDPVTSLTITGVVQDPNGTNNLTKVGGGTLIFTSANTYHGTTTVAAGILDIRDSQGLGKARAGTTVQDGATLQLDVDALPDSLTGTTNTLVIRDPLFLTGVGVDSLGALRSASGINVVTGPINLVGPEDAIGVDPDPNPTGSKSYFPTYNGLGYAVSGDYSLTVEGPLIGGSTNQFDKVGGGQLILPSANNSFTGPVDIQVGWVTIQDNNSLGATIPGVTQNLQPTTTVEEGASLHLKPLNPGGSLVPTQNFVLYGQGISHPFNLINQEGALLSLDGVNTIPGNILLGDQVGIGAQLLDPGSFPAGQLYLTGWVSDTPSVIKPPPASGHGNEAENVGQPFFVGKNGGTLIITAQMYRIPDDLRLYYGPRGTPGSTRLYDSSTSNYPSQAPTSSFTATITVVYTPTSATVSVVMTGQGTGYNLGGTVPAFGPILSPKMQIIMNEIVNGVGNTDGSGAWNYKVVVMPNNSPGGITKLGSQLLVMQGDGTFKGPVDIQEGVLLNQSNSGLGAGTSTNVVTVESGASLALANSTANNNGGLSAGTQIWGQPLVLNGPGNATVLPPNSSIPLHLAPLVVQSDNSLAGGYTNVFPTDQMWRGPVTLNTSSTIDVPANSRLTVYGGIDDAPNPAPAGSDLVKVGQGELVLQGSGSYRGNTFVGTSTDPDGVNEFYSASNPQPFPGGILTVANSQALGAPTGGTFVDNGSTLQLQGNISIGGESLTIQGQGIAPANLPVPAPQNWFPVGPAPVASATTLGTNKAAVSGRVTGVAVDPTDPQTIYVSTAGGGAWQTVNGGVSWLPLFDNTAAMFTGAVAVAPSNHQIVYLGTGEADNSTESFAGTGVYESTDGGHTWSLLTASSGIANPLVGKAISKIIVDPNDPTRIFVADSDQAINGTPGTQSVPVGIWRFDPTNGWVCLSNIVSAVRKLGSAAVFNPSGFPDQKNPPVPAPQTPGPDDDWRLSFPNTNASYSDLTLVTNVRYNIGNNNSIATYSEVLFMSVDGITPLSNTVNNAVYRCIDPLDTQPIWYVGDGNLLNNNSPPNTVYDQGGGKVFPTNIGSTPPTLRNGNIKIAAGLANPAPGVGVTLYAAITNPSPISQPAQTFLEFQTSLDGGQTWATVAGPASANYQGVQGHYDSAIYTTPDGKTVYIAGQNNVFVSKNSGTAWTDITVDGKNNGPHADAHAIVPAGANLIVGTDGGVWSLATSNNAWNDLNANLDISQLNGVGIDPLSTSSAFGGSQAAGIDQFTGNRAWTQADTNGGASPYGGLVRVDPVNPNNVYGVITTTEIANPGSGVTPTATLRRSTDGGTTWTSLLSQSGKQQFPFLVDSLNPNRLLVGGGGLSESLDQGTTWTNLNFLGDVRALAAAVYQGPFVLDGSFVQVADQGASTYDPNTIYVSNGASIYVTKNKGLAWVDRTSNLAGLGSIVDLEVDPSNRDMAYAVRASIDGQGEVFKTTDAGQSWTDLTFDLPALRAFKLALDPRSGQVFLGTEQGVYALDSTLNSWSPFGTNLPLVKVTDLVLNEALDTLTVATYGRGVYQTWLNKSQANAGVLRAVTGSAVWTGPVYLAGPTLLNADGSPLVRAGAPNAQLNIVGTISDVTPGANYSLTKIGGGAITFSGANTYGGLTTVQQGALVVHNIQALGSSTNGTVVNNGAVLQLQSSIVGEPLTLYGNGPLPGVNGHLTGALENTSNNNTYTGPITLVETTNPKTFTPVGVTIGVDSGSTLAITGSINGIDNPSDPNLPPGTAVDLTKELTGTLVLAGPNTYDGRTLVNQGALQVENPLALGTTNVGTFVLDGAQLQMQSPQLQTVTIGGQTTGTFTLTFNGQTTGSLPYGAPATGTGSVQAALNALSSIAGAGGSVSVALSGATYTVTFGGTMAALPQPLILGTGSGGTTVSVTTVNGPPVVVVDEPLNISGTGIFGTGALLDTAGNNTWQGPVTLTSIPAFNPPSTPPTNVFIGVANAGDVLSIDGTVAEASSFGSFGLTKVGPGTLLLKQADTYSNVTTVAAGILAIQNTGALGVVGGPPNHGTVVLDGATLQLDLDPLNTGTPHTMSGETLTLNGLGAGGIGALDNLSGANTWAGAPIVLNDSTAIGVNGGTLTVTGDVSGVPQSALAKDGPGTLFFPTANDYQGTTNVLNGVLNIANNQSLGGTVTSEVQSITLSGAQTGSFTLTFNNQTTSSLPFNVPATGAGSVQSALNGLSSIGGVGGSVNVTRVGNLISVTFGGSLAATSLPLMIASPSTGTSAVVAEVLQGGLGGTTVSGGTLQLQNNITITGEPLQLTGSGFNGLGALDSASGINLWDSPITLAGNTSVAADIDPNLGISTLTVDQAISESVTPSNLTKLGQGNMVFSGPVSNSYTGLTSVTDGTLRLNKSGGAIALAGDLTVGDGTPANPRSDVVRLLAPNQLANTSNVTVNSDGLIDLNNQTQTISSLTMTGGILGFTGAGSQLTLTSTVTATSDSGGSPATVTGPGTLVLAPNGTATATVFTVNPGGGPVDMQVNSVIAGNGIGLTKTGSGTLSLTKSNTYTGSTTVTKGILLADGQNPANTIGAASLNGGTLGGTGTVGPVTVTTVGGTVAPGDNAPGILTVAGDVTLNAKASFKATLGGTTLGTGYSQLLVNGNVTLGSAQLTGVIDNNFVPTVNVDTFTILQTTGANHTISGKFASGATAFFGGYKFSVTYTSTTVTLQRVPITTTTAVAVSPKSGVPNTTFTITATVTPETGATGATTPGTVTIIIVGPSFNQTYTPAVVNNQVVVTLQALALGSYTVTSAKYVSSDPGVGNSQATTQPSFTVGQDTTTTSLPSATPTSPSVFGQPVTFQVTVSPGTAGPVLPTGTVTFYDGTTALPGGTVSVSTSGNQVTASYSTSALSVGPHSINATYNGDTNYKTSSSASLSYTVNKDAAIVTVASSNTNSVYGEAVITVTVAAAPLGAGLPTGTVTFSILNTATSKTATEQDSLSGGVAILQQVLVPASYQITATYSGDGNFLSQNTSNTLAQTVGKANTSVVVASTNTNSVYGEAVITAAVAPVAPGAGLPTGTVTFTVLNTATNQAVTEQDAMVHGIATMQLVPGPGTYQITALYGGDSNFFGQATSNTVAQTVSPASTTVSVASTNANSVYGEAVITATIGVVSPGAGAPTGTVTFSILNNTTSQTSTEQDPLTSGQATLQQVLVPGSYTITAGYSGDPNFSAQPSSNALAQTVSQAATRVTVASSNANSVYGEAVITVSVGPVAPGAGTPTGTVTFSILNKTTSQTTTEQDTLAGGQATLQQILVPGSYTITASYSGDPDFQAQSNSNSLAQTVNLANTTVTVASTNTNSVYGEAVITASVAPVSPATGMPTGTVTFAITNLVSGITTTEQDTLTAGQATLQRILSPGFYAIAAGYNGDPDFNSQGNSNTVNQTVSKASTTVTVASTSPSAIYGQAVITAVVGPVSPGAGTPTGAVTFSILNTNTNQTTTEKDTLAGGTATLQQVLTPGSYTITATYAGDPNFLKQTGSNSVNQTVTPAPTSTTVTSSTANNTSVYGQSVTFTATVNDSPSLVPAAGTVTFFIDGVQQTPDVNVVNGAASLTVTSLSVRATPYAISATYNPANANFVTSSGSLSGGQTVTQATPNIVVSSTANPSVFGQAVTFSATITAPFAGTPTGKASLIITDSQGHTVQQQPNVALSGTSVTFAAITNLVVAATPYNVQVVYNGDTNFASNNAFLTNGQLVNKAGTATTVVSSAANNTSNYGDPVTFTATVAVSGAGNGTPTGHVNFYDGNTLLNPNPVVLAANAGKLQAAYTTTSLQLTGGSHSITAVYLGDDPSFATSTSPAITQTVNRAATTTSDVTASFTGTTPVYNQTITFSATVTAPANLGAFTGAVNFYDNTNTLITSATVNATGTATASVQVNTLSVGTHSITAAYQGDTNFLPSSSQHSLTQQVNPDDSTTTLHTTNANAVYGGASITATVSPVSPGVVTPTGTVTFTVVNTAVSPSVTTTESDPLAGGVATLSVLPPGTFTISAAYKPSTNIYNPSSSTSSLSQTVTQDTTSLAVTTSNASTFYGQPVTFTATITPTVPSGGFVSGASAPTGTVSFTSGSTSLGNPVSVQVVNGKIQAALTLSNLPLGTNQTITAQYNGDTNYSGSTSTVQQTVSQATTSTSLASSSPNNTSSFGQAVTFTATVSVVQGGGLPGGTVDFYDNSVSPANHIGSAPVVTVGSQQLASFTTQPTDLATGSHSITAVYTDTLDNNYGSSTSSTLTQTVTPIVTFTALTSSRITPALGHNVTFTATVNTVIAGLATPTGSVTFSLDGNLTNVNLNGGGQATLTLSTLALGSHTATVTYNPTGNFLGNTSKPLVFTVLTPNQAFVAQVYRDTLAREVDAGGLATWSGLLDRGQLTLAQLVSSIETSQEYRGDVIDATYVHYLHRHADQGGLGTFLRAMAGGMTDEQVAASLIGSPEYFNVRGGATVTGFLTALFQDALNRTIDPTGLQTFTQILGSGVASRQQVAAGILGSPEYQQDLVTNYYNAYLHRSPDPSGLAAWSNALAHGTTDETVIANIIGSDEYYNNL